MQLPDYPTFRKPGFLTMLPHKLEKYCCFFCCLLLCFHFPTGSSSCHFVCLRGRSRDARLPGCYEEIKLHGKVFRLNKNFDRKSAAAESHLRLNCTENCARPMQAPYGSLRLSLPSCTALPRLVVLGYDIAVAISARTMTCWR